MADSKKPANAENQPLTAKKRPLTVDNRPLTEQLAAKRAELLEAQKGLGQTLANPHIIGKLKKDIARILTRINDPAPSEPLAKAKVIKEA